MSIGFSVLPIPTAPVISPATNTVIPPRLEHIGSGYTANIAPLFLGREGMCHAGSASITLLIAFIQSYPENPRCISSYSRFNSPSCKGVALMEANKPKTFAGQQSLCPHKSCPVAVSPGVLQRTEMCSQKKNLPFQQLSSVPSQLPTNENFQESFQCFVSKLLFSCLDRKEMILKFQSQTSFKDSIQHTQKCRNRINFILVDFFLFSSS